MRFTLPLIQRRRWPAVLAVSLLVALIVLGGPASLGRQNAAAQNATGTIAYVSGNNVDEIRLIEPDGSDDRQLWTHGRPDPNEVYEIWSLDWSPDASELAFAGTHEFDCSLDNSDIYVVGADGSQYRRLTQGPDCASLDTYPTGTVRVPVENSSAFGESIDLFLYFQGAPGAKQVSLPPGGSTVVTFENVADMGDGSDWVQAAVAIKATSRYIHISTAVDVKAGQTVTSGTAYLFEPSTPGLELRSPSWRSDGSVIGYAFGFNTLWGIEPQPGPLQYGTDLLADNAELPDFAFNAAYGPTAATANQLLYVGAETFESEAIYLISEGSTTAGEQLVSHEFTDDIFDLAWLPDGSGFIYSVTEGGYFDPDQSANLFEYNFASEQTTRLTDFSGEFAGRLSISPDGEQIVFERADAQNESNRDLIDPDLWIANRDGSGLRLLAENGRAPEWSPQALQAPQPEETSTPEPTETAAPTAEPTAEVTATATSTAEPDAQNERLYLPGLHREG